MVPLSCFLSYLSVTICHISPSRCCSSADNFATLSSQFPQLNQSLGSFSQQSLHALGQQALGQQALHQRSVSLPQRLSPQTGLYDTNPNSLLHALRAHGQPKTLLSLAQQHQQQDQEHHHHQAQQQLLAPSAQHRRLEALQHELPDREASDDSPSGTMSTGTVSLILYAHPCFLFTAVSIACKWHREMHTERCAPAALCSVRLSKSYATLPPHHVSSRHLSSCCTVYAEGRPLHGIQSPSAHNVAVALTAAMLMLYKPAPCSAQRVPKLLGLMQLHCAGPSRHAPVGHADPRLTALTAALPNSPAANSLHHCVPEPHLPQGFSHATLEELRAAAEKFALERDWEKFHSPRNLLLALVSILHAIQRQLLLWYPAPECMFIFGISLGYDTCLWGTSFVCTHCSDSFRQHCVHTGHAFHLFFFMRAHQSPQGLASCVQCRS